MINFNLDEYVSDYLACCEEKPSNHDLAMDIADTVCGQGIVNAETDAEFDLLVHEIEQQLPYYV